jgi:glycyl-tRNA synthetase beta chain
MIITQPLLIELRTEELPPTLLKSLGQRFAQYLHQALVQEELTTSNSLFTPFATPRRLAVRINNVLSAQPDRPQERKGPHKKNAFTPDGQPTPALIGFAKSCSVPWADLTLDSDGKFSYTQTLTGRSLTDCLPSLLQKTLAQLPAHKLMRWGNTPYTFIRPIHGWVVLHGTSSIPFDLMGIKATPHTLGNRFQGAHTVTITHANDYEKCLEELGKVIAHYDTRQEIIQTKLREQAKGDKLVISPALLDEITSLVEWPAVYRGSFSPSFLTIPTECLILSMQKHQKYIPLKDGNNTLLPEFLLVSAIETNTPIHIIEGNERVLNARLSDAEFFYAQDLNTEISRFQNKLQQVIYHHQLGSMQERLERIKNIALNLSQVSPIPNDTLHNVITWLKLDLVSEMVGEFPELQGIMGRYYCQSHGLSEAIGEAIEDHYHPRFAEDTLPRSELGALFALADKTESLVGLFSIGQIPTGDKDPYGLRRATLGIIRILMESKTPISLHQLLQHTISIFKTPTPTQILIHSFILERLKGYLKDQGFAIDHIESVTQSLPEFLHPLPQRLKAIRQFVQTPEASALITSNKRIHNLLKKTDQSILPFKHWQNYLKEPQEQALYHALTVLTPQIQQDIAQGLEQQALDRLALLRTPIDLFFEDIMVLCEETSLRNARLTLLKNIHDLMNLVGDLTQLRTVQ